MGAEFIAEEGVLKGLILSLERGEEWTIGRDPDLCTIVIEDPKVSREQVRIRKTEAGYTVENLSATTPVLVGGTPIEGPTLLKDEDRLTIGGSVFRFHPEGAPAAFAFESEAFDEEPFVEDESPEEEVEEEPPVQEKAFEDTQEAEEEVEEEDEDEEEELFTSRSPSFEKELPEEELVEETLFDESEVPDMQVDLTQTTRFILKVIAGPNTGAEFALDTDRQYLIGTDTGTCDIIFNDLSVSREHARLISSKDGVVSIQDLGSRNGVVVDRERVVGTKTLPANAVVALGTSAFLLIDKEAPSETIAAPLFETPAEEEVEVEEEVVAADAPLSDQARPKKLVPAGSLVLALIIGGLAVLLGIGMVSLFQTETVEYEKKDYTAELKSIIDQYPAVRYTYNTANGKLFLLGHVQTGVEHNELLYQLRGHSFITGIDDNIVNDEAVWQEMNILLSKHADFKGVSMHSPAPGVFVVAGYLHTERQAADLIDYLNINFNYLNLLQNRVIVEQSIAEEVSSRLIQQGFGAVNARLSNGDLQLTGYINSNQAFGFDKLTEELKVIPGIRSVHNFVALVTPEEGVIDLNKKYLDTPTLTKSPNTSTKSPNTSPRPPRYRVTGYSKHGDVNINVVINGRIVTRGDCIDGYTVTSIQPQMIFMEKEGLKYKIEYNKCNSYGCGG